MVEFIERDKRGVKRCLKRSLTCIPSSYMDKASSTALYLDTLDRTIEPHGSCF